MHLTRSWRVPAVSILLLILLARPVDHAKSPIAKIRKRSAIIATPARPAAPRVEHDPDATSRLDDILLRIRAFPYRRLPPGARARAVEQANRLRTPRDVVASLSSASQPNAAQQWTLIGPRPTYNGDAGRVTAIAVHPHDNNTVYIGGAEGGVWKTTDGGNTWIPLTDFQPALAIGSLAIDPSNPNIIYAGTGEANFNADAYGGMGILKSTDAGATWAMLANTTFDQQSIGALAVSPNNSNIILAAADTGLYRSTDAGQTWQTMMFDLATSVLFDPTNGQIAYAGLVGLADPSGVYKSTDGGHTWQISNGAVPTAIKLSARTFRLTLAISPSAPSTLYAGVDVSTSSSSPLAGFFKSTDGGSSWHQMGGDAYCVSQCWYNNVLAVSPSNPNLLVGGGVRLVQSVDGGKTWTSAAGPGMHVDQHAVAFTADGSSLFVANDGGVWSSKTVNNEFSWINLNATLALTQFYPGVSVKPGNAAVAFGGTQDNATLAYLRGQWQTVACGDGSATAIDPGNPENVYIACAALAPGSGAIQKSTTGGSPGSFQESDEGISAVEGVPFLPYLTIDPSHPQNLYFTGNKHIYQSTNFGITWAAISPDVTAGLLWPCVIGVAPGDSNTVYSGSCDGVVQVTHNAMAAKNSTWTDISAGLPGTAVTHIAVDPTSASHAFATLSGFQSGHVFVTQDGGQIWTDITSNLPDISANDLIIDPDLPGTLYVATDLGVFWTNNDGGVWSEIGSGLPQSAVLSLSFEHTSRTLRAATHGRSIWDLMVPMQGLNLIPTIASASPTQYTLSAAPGMLTINGANFTNNSIVLWNGQSRPTTFASSSQVQAALTGADVSADQLVSVTVLTPGPGGGTSAPTYIKIGPDPAIYPHGLVNAASYVDGGVAPGSIVSVFGVNFASGLSSIRSLPLPLSLNGTSMAVADPNAGYAGSAPLFFVSAAQTNIQIPWEVLAYDTATLTPVLHGVNGVPINVPVRTFAPGIFTVDQSGHGQGTITNAVTGQLAAPAGTVPGAQPVKRGGYISIYCTGMGPVDNPPPDGTPAPPSPLVHTLVQPVVWIGGMQGKVTFSGLAPGFIGLNQINVQIPENAPTGGAVLLSISDGGGGVSNTVTIAID